MKKLASILMIVSLILTFLSIAAMSIATFGGGEELDLSIDAAVTGIKDDTTKITLTGENTGSKTLTDVTFFLYLPKDVRLTTSSPAPETAFRKMVPGSKGSNFVLTVYDDDNKNQDSSAVEAINDAVERAKHNEEVKKAFGEGFVSFLQNIQKAFPIVLAAAIGLFVIAFFLKGNGRAVMALLLVLCLVLGAGGATVLSFLIGSREGKIALVEKRIEIGKEDVTVYGVAYYHVSVMDDPFAWSTVTFESAPGTLIPDQKVKAGDIVRIPATPVREGFVCVGWYLDDTFTQKYDFATPVSGSMTLYAKWANSFTGWDTDGDGIADSDEILYGSDPEKADDTESDTDKDGLIDYLELYVYQSDINKPDTDGDNLTDGKEVFATHTDPVIEDTNGNGVSDYDEDPDEDQMINGIEVQTGTDPLLEDTDFDNFLDGEELQAGTDPLNDDTDGDEALDGWEVAHGYDPLTIDQSFEVEVTTTNPDNGMHIHAEFVGNPEDITIEETEMEGLLDESIPGYLGAACKLEYEGVAGDVVVAFPVGQVGSDVDAVIYAFDEDTQLLQELPTTIKDGEAVSTVTVEEISGLAQETQTGDKTVSSVTFILLNKLLLDEVWETRILPPDGNTYNESVFEMVFVIDYSSSMDSNDPDYLRLDIVCEFIDKLRPGHDVGAVIKFAAAATTLVPLTDDLEALKNTTKEITNADGSGCSSEDGTDGSAGIYEGIEQLKNTDSEYRYIIFLTDGRDNSYSHDYDELITDAVNNHITIFTIGMGNVDEELLTKIADGTGGTYYFASVAEGEEIDAIGLDDAFYDIGVSTIDYASDSNEDGISDYYTKLMCEGTLRSGTGARLFEGISMEDVQANADYDGDGLTNGEEVKIRFDEKTQRTYMIVISSPVMKDSDDDGVNDKDDTAPLVKGLAGGVYGKLALISCYNTDDAGWTSGHAYFVYTSFIRDTLDLSGLETGWHRANYEGPWAFENLERDYSPTSAYKMEPGECIAIGNGAFEPTLGEFCGSGTPTSDANGVDYNMEVYKHLDSTTAYSYLYNTYLEETITGKQLAALIAFLGQDSVSYWSACHNCAEVACQGWNYIAYTYVSPYDNGFFAGSIATPKGLTHNMRKLEGGYHDNFDMATAFPS